jgi:tetratricopeptide (TPR) repeat protein
LVAEVRDRHATWTRRAEDLQMKFRGQDRADLPEDAGWFYYRTQDFPRAIDCWERAVAERPEADTYARLGYARRKQGQREGAMEAWAAALALDPERADLYKELGTIALEGGLVEQAEDFLREACRLEPDDSEACEQLGRLLCASGAFVEAGMCYENVLRIDPARQELVPQIVALYQRQIDLAATTQ